MLYFVPVLRGCVWSPTISSAVMVMQVRMLFSSVFAITERRDMGLYDVLLSLLGLGMGMGTMLANFYMCDILLRARKTLTYVAFRRSVGKNIRNLE